MFCAIFKILQYFAKTIPYWLKIYRITGEISPSHIEPYIALLDLVLFFIKACQFLKFDFYFFLFWDPEFVQNKIKNGQNLVDSKLIIATNFASLCLFD